MLRLYLEQLSPSILKKILAEHRKEFKSNSPNDMVSYLNTFLLNYNNLSDIYRHMTAEEKEVLEYFVQQIPNEALTYKKLNDFRGRLPRDEFEAALIKLNRKGIIFKINKGLGNLSFIIPEDLFIIWHKFFNCEILSKLKQFNREGLNNTCQDLLDENLFRLLVFIQKEESITITKGNSIPKKHIIRLASKLEFNNKLQKYIPIDIKNPINKCLHEYKEILLLIEIAHLLELITFYNNSLITTDKILWWFSLNIDIRHDFLEKAIGCCLKSSDLLINNLFYLIFSLEKETWYSSNEILKNLSRKNHRHYGEEILLRANNEIFDSLCAFGWLEKIEDNKEIYIKRVKLKYDETIYFYVQPNFDLLVPYNFPHNIRFKIEQFASLERNDFINRYVLSKESIIKGIENGLSADEIITLLKEYSANQLSKNIVQTIYDWALCYGTVSFHDVRLMRCSSDLVAKEIKYNEILKKWIIEELDSSSYVIKRSDFESLIKELNSINIFPKTIKEERKNEKNIDENLMEDYTGIYRWKGYEIEL